MTDLITSAIAAGNHDESALTDLEFYRRHPELVECRLGKDDRDLAEEWTGIRDDVVRPALLRFHEQSALACPAQLRLIKGIGYEGSGGGAVAACLERLRADKGLAISDDDIDMFQRIAEVESGGHLTCINTWDSAVLSAGFMQWTLKYGELADWIRSAPAAFARYDIELDDRQYSIGSEQPCALKGAARYDELRQLPWAVRFARATADPDVVIAEVRMALDKELSRQRAILEKHVNQCVNGGWDRIADYYRRSSLVRALLHEAYNNRPRYAQAAAAALAQSLDTSLSDADFVTALCSAIKDAYGQSSEQGAADKAERLTTKVQRPAPFCATAAEGRVPAAEPPPAGETAPPVDTPAPLA